MTAPTFGLLATHINDRINDFYNKSSILPGHRYIVGLFGKYVEEAINYMEKGSTRDNTFTGREYERIDKTHYNKLFNNWKETFSPKDVLNKDEVDLRWTVSSVTIPTIKATTTSDIIIDTTKSIYYPLVTECQKTDTITCTIVEDRSMGMYQFFNALMNMFYTSQVLKPRSSFHKLNMYVIILNGDYIKNPFEFIKTKNRPENWAEFKNTTISDIPLQVFEFNSIVLKSIGQFTFAANNPKKITFQVTFEAPNIFQGAYTTTTLKDLKDNTSDATTVNTTLKRATEVNKDGSYITNNFEITDTDLKSETNGYYADRY